MKHLIQQRIERLVLKRASFGLETRNPYFATSPYWTCWERFVSAGKIIKQNGFFVLAGGQS